MTSQTVMSNHSSTLVRSQSTADNSQRGSSAALSTPCALSLKSIKCVYQADQQVKLLHLQAEVESLLLQLQTLKQQRLTTPLSSVGQEADDRNSN